MPYGMNTELIQFGVETLGAELSFADLLNHCEFRPAII